MSFNQLSSNQAPSSASASEKFLPLHGGALKAAADFFDIPHEQWLDISTGINPVSWPVPDIPTHVWQRLPEDQCNAEDSLEQAALSYYLTNIPTAVSSFTTKITSPNNEPLSPEKVSVHNLLSCAGSQQGIRLLPLLYAVYKNAHKTEAKVWVTSGSYAEHGIAWEDQGHRVRKVACDKITELLTQQPVDVLILVNPDNPSGHRWSVEQLLKWWTILQRRGGWLIVDEAFMDMTPEQSLCGSVERNGLFVLRSVGKFFGLAGLRLGFVFAAANNIQRLHKMLGPWVLSHPAQYLGRLAVQDENWIRNQNKELVQQSVRLNTLLQKHTGCDVQGTYLFKTVYHPESEQIFTQLAQQAILVRYLPATSKTAEGLRFGLLGNNEKDWQRLDSALRQLIF